MSELAQVDDIDERERLMAVRQQEIEDAASDLRRSRLPWRRGNLASLGLGIAGTAWSLLHGDPVGPVLSAAKSLSDRRSAKGKDAQVTAYSYIFDIRRQFGSGGAS